MSKKLQLSIAEPCHENWDGMTPVEKGKFCGACQKQVVDFSIMSDRQVADFFKKPSTGSVCGRFMTDQLDRGIEIPRKRIPWVKYFFQIALPAFFFSVKTSAAKTQGEIKIRTATKDTIRRSVYDDVKMLGMVSRPMNIRPLMGDTVVTPVNLIKGEIETVCCELLTGKVSPLFVDTKADTLRIKGKVIDPTGNPISYASIIIKGTKNGVVTDANGEFSILRVSKWETITLVSSCMGFETTEIVVDRKSYAGNIIIQPVKSIYELMGAVIVTKCYSKKLVKPIPLLPDLAQETTARSFKVFPNPVPPGANLSIEWKQTEEGYYTFQLLNQSGQSVHSREIWIDTEARVLNIDVLLVSAGNYFLVLTNKKTGKKFSEKIIIQ